MTTETWFYAGQRLTTKNKLAHAWLPPDTGLGFMLYKKLAGHTIGGAYEVDVTRNGDTVSVQTNIKGTGQTHLLALQWRGDDSTHRARYAELQRAAKDKRDSRDISDLTLAQVAAQYQNLVGAHKPAFLAQVLTRIMRG